MGSRDDQRPAAARSLFLARVDGPDMAAVELAETLSSYDLGRSSRCQVVLHHEDVSRLHARLMRDAQSWILIDLGSRHGTQLNGVRLAPMRPTPIREGDLVQIGPWTLRVSSLELPALTREIADVADGETKTGPEVTQTSLAPERLERLMRCATDLGRATSEEHVAEIILRLASDGTDMMHGAVIRRIDDDEQVQVVASLPASGAPETQAPYSRSLVRAASTGKPAWYSRSGNSSGHAALSIERSGVLAAICSPMIVGDVPWAYLYLHDTMEERDCAEAVVYCEALCRLAALALANIKRAELERRQQQFEEELALARAVQELILPAQRGSVSGYEYAVSMHAGLAVAGDIFDVVPLDSDRVAIMLGDVAGKGLGSAMMMAATQSFLRCALLTRELDTAMSLTNQFVAERAAGRFVSLWVGCFERNSPHVRFVDAGHGLWFVRAADGAVLPAANKGGSTPLGIDREWEPHAGSIKLSADERLILFSDGAIEQRSPMGIDFGIERLAQIIAASNSTQVDVDKSLIAIREHAQSDRLRDDTTIASIARSSA